MKLMLAAAGMIGLDHAPTVFKIKQHFATPDDINKTPRVHGKTIHVGTYRRPYGFGHGKAEREMRRAERQQRRRAVMIRGKAA